MIFDALKFLKSYRITNTTEGNRSRRGWVQINCPFCGGGERGWDLGINLTDERVACWRCKGHHLVPLIQKLLKCSRDEADRIYKQFQSRSIVAPDYAEHIDRIDKPVYLPFGTAPLHTLPRHMDYLRNRQFRPEILEKMYGLQGTVVNKDYGYRIIIPITYEGVLVSFQGRDITGLVDKDKRYKACAMKDEAIHHKHVLYGWDQAEGDSCCVVEGVTDKWRLGPGSLATFGTGFTEEQAKLLYKRFKRIFMLFDPEPQAQIIAEQLGWYLAGMGREVIFPEGWGTDDPGSMKQDDADHLMGEMGLRGWRL